MTPGTTTSTLFILWAAGVCESVLITQWPRYISSPPNRPVEMQCYQNNTDYQYLYWYRQLRGDTFQLMVVIVVGKANFEEGFKSGFEAKRSTEKQWSLTINSAKQPDEAVYLCAASSEHCQYEAYFGQGTKLTVLKTGREIEPPKVEILGPSLNECRNKKDKKKKKTLVCVASGFYPDHVSVSWQVGGKEVTKGVATDGEARRNGRKYRISSRLRVPAEHWFTPGKKFICIVSFFDGINNNNYNATISGVKGETQTLMTRERYLRITQSAKLSYSIFIVKSCVYGVFVGFLVWKIQSLGGKQIN
ncbi:M1-specific T cell receptor beta chain-like [Embiotoca jacksoni]|uniref:M1-specific T cell receptor beta chain-like n=1 Tax=Embiotoca jacksoni TaxID=100190 RepID=UPI00370394C3